MPGCCAGVLGGLARAAFRGLSGPCTALAAGGAAGRLAGAWTDTCLPPPNAGGGTDEVRRSSRASGRVSRRSPRPSCLRGSSRARGRSALAGLVGIVATGPPAEWGAPVADGCWSPLGCPGATGSCDGTRLLTAGPAAGGVGRPGTGRGGCVSRDEPTACPEGGCEAGGEGSVVRTDRGLTGGRSPAAAVPAPRRARAGIRAAGVTTLSL